jgi:hypothetical protein
MAKAATGRCRRRTVRLLAIAAAADDGENCHENVEKNRFICSFFAGANVFLLVCAAACSCGRKSSVCYLPQAVAAAAAAAEILRLKWSFLAG